MIAPDLVADCCCGWQLVGVGGCRESGCGYSLGKVPFFSSEKIVGGVDNTDNYYQEGRSVILVMFNMLTCDVGETGTLNGVRKGGAMGE